MKKILKLFFLGFEMCSVKFIGKFYLLHSIGFEQQS